MPVDREIKNELEAFRSDVHAEVKEMNAAAIRHVEKIIAPFTDVPVRLGAVEQQTTATKEETAKQTPILHDLQEEARLAKKARAAAKKERISRSAIDAEWRKNRKRIAGALGLLVLVGEIYHAFFAK